MIEIWQWRIWWRWWNKNNNLLNKFLTQDKSEEETTNNQYWKQRSPTSSPAPLQVCSPKKKLLLHLPNQISAVIKQLAQLSISPLSMMLSVHVQTSKTIVSVSLMAHLSLTKMATLILFHYLRRRCSLGHSDIMILSIVLPFWSRLSMLGNPPKKQVCCWEYQITFITSVVHFILHLTR